MATPLRKPVIAQRCRWTSTVLSQWRWRSPEWPPGWLDLFDDGRLAAGQRVLIHGAAVGVGAIAVQLAGKVGACVTDTGRAADPDWPGRKPRLAGGARHPTCSDLVTES